MTQKNNLKLLPVETASLVKALDMFFSLIVFIIGLWLGSVLGLNGTYWN